MRYNTFQIITVTFSELERDPGKVGSLGETTKLYGLINMAIISSLMAS